MSHSLTWIVNVWSHQVGIVTHCWFVIWIQILHSGLCQSISALIRYSLVLVCFFSLITQFCCACAYRYLPLDWYTACVSPHGMYHMRLMHNTFERSLLIYNMHLFKIHNCHTFLSLPVLFSPSWPSITSTKYLLLSTKLPSQQSHPPRLPARAKGRTE